MFNTDIGVAIDSKLIANYFKKLVDMVFKILPMKENDEPTVDTYIDSLKKEILGCKSLVCELHDDAMLISLVSTLQQIKEQDIAITDVKRDVFKSIAICNRLRDKYTGPEA